ncbi:MAG: hypothetical protein R6U44_00625 [Archaeoglobaceae archaeon]
MSSKGLYSTNLLTSMGVHLDDQAREYLRRYDHIVKEIVHNRFLENKTLGEAVNFLEVDLLTLLNILGELKKLEVIKEFKIK